MGGSGAGSTLSIVPTVLNHVLGTKFRIIEGYKAAQDVLLAIERGELQGVCSSYSQFRGYDRLFREAGLVASGRVVLPVTAMNRHIFNQYVIRVAHRDALQAHLKARGVGTEVYYPVPMHLQECFAYLGHRAGAFPESERAAKETVALPIGPELTDEQASYVVDCIGAFVGKDQPFSPDQPAAELAAAPANVAAN